MPDWTVLHDDDAEETGEKPEDESSDKEESEGDE